LKVLFAASSGGHLEEIKRLENLVDLADGVLLTEKVNYSTNDGQRRVYYVPQVNRREPLCLIKLIWIFFLSMRVILQEKPDFIISTGALAALPVCFISRLFSIQLIYIESFARRTELSLSGKLIYKFADVFVVQWEELLALYPKAVYWGMIY